MMIDYDITKKHIRGFVIKENKISFHNHISYKKASSVLNSSQHHYDQSKSEIVFKIVSYIKTQKSSAALLHYVAQHSSGLNSPINLYDELGNKITNKDISSSIQSLGIKDETINKNGKLARQAVHFIVSFPNDNTLSAENTLNFMQDYLKPFSDAGYNYRLGIHTHQSATHAHVILSLNNGEQHLKFNKKEISQMRERIVEIGQNYGLDLQSTRTYERNYGILKPLKQNKKTLLERQVPNWFSLREEEKDRASFGFIHLMDIPHYKISEPSQTILDKWAVQFEEPLSSQASFIEMFAEAPKTAFWYANKKPNVFGKLRDENQPSQKKVYLNENNFSVPIEVCQKICPSLTQDKSKEQKVSQKKGHIKIISYTFFLTLKLFH